MQQEQRAEVLNQLKEEMSSKRFDETVDQVVEQTTAFDQVRILLYN
jgi:ribosomal protein L29